LPLFHAILISQHRWIPVSTFTRVASSGSVALGTWLVWGPSEAPRQTPPVKELAQVATRGTAEDPDARRNSEKLFMKIGVL